MGTMGTYRIFGVGDNRLGGIMTTPGASPRRRWLFYTETGDLDAALRRATTKGRNPQWPDGRAMGRADRPARGSAGGGVRTAPGSEEVAGPMVVVGGQAVNSGQPLHEGHPGHAQREQERGQRLLGGSPGLALQPAVGLHLALEGHLGQLQQPGGLGRIEVGADHLGLAGEQLDAGEERRQHQRHLPPPHLHRLRPQPGEVEADVGHREDDGLAARPGQGVASPAGQVAPDRVGRLRLGGVADLLVEPHLQRLQPGHLPDLLDHRRRVGRRGAAG